MSKTIKTGYKIVGVDDREGVYASAYDESMPASVVYIPGKWVEPRDVEGHRNGPLAVFGNWQDLMEFYTCVSLGPGKLGHGRYHQIWECLYIESEENDLYYWFRHVTIKDAQLLICTAHHQEVSIPPGTRFADKVMLTRRVI